MATKIGRSKPASKSSGTPKPAPDDFGPILELIAAVVPDFQRWIVTPNRDLAGHAPQDLFDTPYESAVRDMVLACKYGTFA